MNKEEYLEMLFQQYNNGLIDGDTYDYYYAHCDEIWDFEEEE